MAHHMASKTISTSESHVPQNIPLYLIYIKNASRGTFNDANNILSL